MNTLLSIPLGYMDFTAMMTIFRQCADESDWTDGIDSSDMTYDSDASDDGGSSDGSYSDLEGSEDSDVVDMETDESDCTDSSSSDSSDDLVSEFGKLMLEGHHGRWTNTHTSHCKQKSYRTDNMAKGKATNKEVGNADLSFLYIMTDNNERFKVGRSKNPWRRLRQLRTGNLDLKLLDCFKVSSIRAETVAHRALRMRYHSTREWFYAAYGDVKSVVSNSISDYLL